MSEVQEQFAQAQKDVNALPSRPDNNTMLKLYALYKQATLGDAGGDAPSSFDFIARAKFDAWNALKGTATPDAMRQYVELVKALGKTQ
jgi:diazepam-binding inhibitor (GABA receptor modulator, acyl-CoA-binding protein)